MAQVTLEIRRHAERAKDGDAVGALSAAGRAMAARLAGRPFALVVASPRERARETAVVIAGRVDQVHPSLDTAPDDALTQQQYDSMRSQDEVMRLLEMPSAARDFVASQLRVWDRIADRLDDGAHALIITHGGNIELLGAWLASRLGSLIDPLPLSYCEGLLVRFEDGRAVALERLGPNPRHAESPRPPRSVLRAFGVDDPPVSYSSGRARTWLAGETVLKPVDDKSEAAWVADLAASIEQTGFRIALPVAAADGRWIVDGWSAWDRLDGEHSTTRWPELLAAAQAFHDAVRHIPPPAFIARPANANRWRIADRIAWGETAADDLGNVRHLPALIAARRPVHLPRQLIHGDLVGNVLFADDAPPGIIDLSLYWRPPGYSAALVVADAIAWEGASADILDLIRHYDQWSQLLLRAVFFRVVVNELARRAEPWRADVGDHYAGLVELTLSALGRS